MITLSNQFAQLLRNGISIEYQDSELILPAAYSSYALSTGKRRYLKRSNLYSHELKKTNEAIFRNVEKADLTCYRNMCTRLIEDSALMNAVIQNMLQKIVGLRNGRSSESNHELADFWVDMFTGEKSLRQYELSEIGFPNRYIERCKIVYTLLTELKAKSTTQAHQIGSLTALIKLIIEKMESIGLASES